MNIQRIAEQTIVGLVVAGISALVNSLLADKINIVLVVVGFTLGFLATLIFFKQNKESSILGALNLFIQENSNGTISGGQLAQMVQGMFSTDIVRTVRDTVPQLRGLSAKEASGIMAEAYSSDQIRILELLEPKIRRPISSKDIETLLSGLYSSDRAKASKILSRRG